MLLKKYFSNSFLVISLLGSCFELIYRMYGKITAAIIWQKYCGSVSLWSKYKDCAAFTFYSFRCLYLWEFIISTFRQNFSNTSSQGDHSCFNREQRWFRHKQLCVEKCEDCGPFEISLKLHSDNKIHDYLARTHAPLPLIGPVKTDNLTAHWLYWRIEAQLNL
jgi:hypothetical protein